MAYFPNQDVSPNNRVVYVQVEWSNGTFSRGSGAFVGANDVLTAALDRRPEKSKSPPGRVGP